MFYLKTKDKSAKFNYWLNYITGILVIPVGVYLLITTLNFIKSHNADELFLSIFIVSIVSSILAIVYQFIGFFSTIYFRRQAVLELFKIIYETKLPQKLPKVVFVYTTHNDFWESRLLQSMQQTYENIEYWISDGSDNPEVINKIKEFVSKHNNVNYYSLNRSSENKADNLNDFLKKSGATFDYLLISDADVAINSNFVSTSLKFFYSKNQIRLGWVSAAILNFKQNNFFTNLFKINDDLEFTFDHQSRNFKGDEQVNLYSATALISGELLKEFNYQFPNSCLEDAWLENISTKRGWEGLINVFSYSLQAYDINIYAHHTRVSRVYDWSWKYFKESWFINQNDSKLEFYKKGFDLHVISPLLKIIYPLILSFSILILYKMDWSDWRVSLIIVIIINSLVSLIIGIIKKFYFSRVNPLVCIFIESFSFIAKYWTEIARKFNPIFRSKYASFVPTRNVKGIKSRKYINLYKLRYILWSFLIVSILLLGVDLSFILTNTFNYNDGILFLFIVLNLYLGSMFLSLFAFIFLYSLSFIKTNKKYNRNDFVYVPNKKNNDEKNVREWCLKNNINMNEVLK